MFQAEENSKDKIIEGMGIGQSFKMAFNQYHAALCFFADKLVQDRTEAEDIVEDVFIKLWEKEPDFGRYRNIKAVLYIAVKNACLDHIKKRRRDITKHSGLAYTLQQETEGFVLLEIVRAEVLRGLYAAMENQPIERRNVMQLIYVEGWDSQKVAEHLDISIHTVKKHRLRGIKDLKGSGVGFLWVVLIVWFMQ